MERHIDEHTAEAQFKQIMELATNNHQTFLVDRQGEPAIVIMSIQDYMRMAMAVPDWLQDAWKGAKQRGIDSMTMEEIDAEIDEYRIEKALEHEAR